MDTEKIISAEQKREIGKFHFFHHGGDLEKRDYGLKLILEAHNEGDAEAKFVLSRLILDGVLGTRTDSPEEHALRLMCDAAHRGCIQARAHLNAYCLSRYRDKMGKEPSQTLPSGPLVDFEGKPIRIDRKGVFTPIDAVLEYKDGRNVLTLSTNLMFLYFDHFAHSETFERAVLDGLQAWQGEYEVFGGQKLSVCVNVTREDNLYDNLVIVPVTDEFSELIRSAGDWLGTKKGKKKLSEVLEQKRSFEVSGLKWTVNSRKMIFLFGKNGNFDDYEEIMHVTKHEFGHALGLGDLYASEFDSLPGVEKGTYLELDGYAIEDRRYNLVMCDHNGPISNNDIEMVVLAFRENAEQLFQLNQTKGKISAALGKGN